MVKDVVLGRLRSAMPLSLRIWMTDRTFYLALTLLVLALAGGEAAYGVFGPFSARQHQIDEFSSSNRAPPWRAERPR